MAKTVEAKIAAKPELLDVIKYQGREIRTYMDTDGNAMCRDEKDRLIIKGDVMSQCFHLAKWTIRNQNRARQIL